LIDLKKYKEIVQSIENTKFEGLSDLKEKVDKKFSYTELRMVLASMGK
jgi:uncharacterized protein YpbB